MSGAPIIASAGSLAALDWRRVEPNDAGDWLGQRSPEFETYPPIGSKDAGRHRLHFLELSSAGTQTNRDAWVYNHSKPVVEARTRATIATYNANVARAIDGDAERLLDATQISWTSSLESRFRRKQTIDDRQDETLVTMYRPFTKAWLRRTPALIHRPGQLSNAFPDAESVNWGFYMTAPGSGHAFSLLALDKMPDLALWGSGSGQFFPRYRFEPDEGDLLSALDPGSGWRRTDNVTDEILADYRATFGKGVTKDDIFHYLYGILHSPDYRARFETDLKKMLPRIPKVRAFREFAGAGAELARLHIGYETTTPHPLDIDRREGASLRVEKMRYGKTGGQVDKSTIVYNSGISVRGIPIEAQEYMLGARSALDWILERYQVKTDKRSGIVNDPNAWGEEHGDPHYILDLIGRITTVSLKTVHIVKSLPPLEIA